MGNENELRLPIYKNWVAFNASVSTKRYSEYELFSDAIITGEDTTSFGPYQFINLCSPHNSNVKVALIVRLDDRLSYNYQVLPNMKKTDTSCYHGGSLIDEVAAIVSLAMGIRVKAGNLIREFAPSGDKFGRPVGWEMSVIPEIRPEYGRYKLPSVVRNSSVLLLEPFKNMVNLSEDNAISLVKAARLYQQALWIAESDPSLSWIMFVSALETAANQWRINQESPSDRLKFAKPELYEYLFTLNITDIVEKIAGYISDSLGATRKFVDFVTTFLPPVPEKRPPQYLQCSWELQDIQNTMKIIYSYRSAALHGGTPFPLPMCEIPHNQKDFLAPAEKTMGLATHANSGTWVNEDTPMLLNTFEYITRNCLLNWWKQLK